MLPLWTVTTGGQEQFRAPTRGSGVTLWETWSAHSQRVIYLPLHLASVPGVQGPSAGRTTQLNQFCHLVDTFHTRYPCFRVFSAVTEGQVLMGKTWSEGW